MKHRLIILFFLVATTTSMLSANEARSVSANDWRAGSIVSDPLFYDGDDMSISEIQAFLHAQVPVCDTWGQKVRSDGRTRASYGTSVGVPPPYVCVKDYYENPTTHETNFNSTASIPAGAISASQIIYEASIRYNINPKVLFVTLKKEAADNLIGDDWPWLSQYRSAMGYGCPDTAPCDAQYYGFYNQIENAAKQFRRYATYPGSYRYQAGQTNFIQYHPDAACSGTNVFIESLATAGLYNYTPYQPNGAALANMYGEGDGCSAYGNRNFWRIWSDWFGSTTGPAAFRAEGSSVIYVPIMQYKMAVPYSAAMQDYGISSESVKSVSQAYVDSLPSPPPATNLSDTISHVIKTPSDSDSDGGALYLISLGKRYQFKTMEQFYTFGFTESDIRYLPIEYVLTKRSGGLLSSFVSSPLGSIFEVDTVSKTKQILFEYQTYITKNPSDSLAGLSYYLVDKIPSGKPIVDHPVLIKYTTGDSITLYTKTGEYHTVPTYDEYKCWGFENTLKTPVYRLPQNNYISPITASSSVSCTNAHENTPNLMTNGYRSPIPTSFGFSKSEIDSSILELYLKVPVRATQVSEYAKSNNSPSVWHLDVMKKRLIPTYDTFLAMGLGDTNIDVVPVDFLNAFSSDGILIARGQLVKDSGSATVYVADDNRRYGIASSDLFLSYKNQWGDIATLNTTELNASYPVVGDISPILVDKTLSRVYVIGINGCFKVTDPLTLLGKTTEQLSASQPYESSLLKNIKLASCSAATSFVKAPGQNLVYWIHDGYKTPLTTYVSMLQKNNGVEPLVMQIDPLYIQSMMSN